MATPSKRSAHITVTAPGNRVGVLVIGETTTATELSPIAARFDLDAARGQTGPTTSRKSALRRREHAT